MKIIKEWVWPIVAGFIVVSIIMMFFEWINHFIFPLPANLDPNDTVSVRSFTSNLPWTAYILVFIGWAVGAFEGGCTTAWLSGEERFRITAALTVLLMLAGLFDMFTFGFPPLATLLGLIILGAFPRLGYHALHVYEKRKQDRMIK